MSLRKQAAKILGKTERQIKRLINQGKLPKVSEGADAFLAEVERISKGGDLKESFSSDRHNVKESILSTKHITNIDQLLTMMDIDQDIWDVEKVNCNYWGKPGNDNLQLKAILKRNEKLDEAFIRDVFNKLKSPKKFTASKPAKGDYMLKINLHDLHYGKLCWQPESGENYDSRIARKRFLNALATFADHVAHKKIKEVWFPVGNDFFNSDNVEMATTAGTGQHDDGRWQKTYHEGTQLLIDGIDFIRQNIAPVKVYNVGGNHDLQKSFYATLHLSAYYKNCKGVSVDISPAKHKAYQFGNVGIMDTHGDRIKRQELMQDFMVLFPDIWCNTKFREVHIGHLHHEVTTEMKGGKVRVMPSMSGTDAYHFNAGYVGTLAQSQAFLFHNKIGLSAIYNHNVI